MNSSTHLHWIVWFYRGINADGGCIDNTSLDVIAGTHQEALTKAQKLMPASIKGGFESGAGYRVAQLVEHFGEDCSK